MDWTAVIVACVTAIPLSIAAWASLRNRRSLATGNGKTIGQTVAELWRAVAALEGEIHHLGRRFDEDRRERESFQPVIDYVIELMGSRDDGPAETEA